MWQLTHSRCSVHRVTLRACGHDSVRRFSYSALHGLLEEATDCARSTKFAYHPSLPVVSVLYE
jgi:hypothetical protein